MAYFGSAFFSLAWPQDLGLLISKRIVGQEFDC